MNKYREKITAKEKCKQRLLSLEKSLKSLKEAHAFYLKEPDKTIHIMALVKSFEFSFELSWKALKYFLEYKEVIKISVCQRYYQASFS